MEKGLRRELRVRRAGKELVEAVDAQGIAFQAIQGETFPQRDEGEVPCRAVPHLDISDELHRVAVAVEAVEAHRAAVLDVGNALGQRVGRRERIVGLQGGGVVLPEIPAFGFREKIVLRRGGRGRDSRNQARPAQKEQETNRRKLHL